MESTENPFTANGVLSQKADYIITHSTITRTEIHIADPDTVQVKVSQPEQPQQQNENTANDENATENDAETEDVVQIVKTQPTESSVIPTENSVPSTPKVKEQSKKPVAANVEPIEAEVCKADVAEPQRAEEVRLKKKKRCCSVL